MKKNFLLALLVPLLHVSAVPKDGPCPAPKTNGMYVYKIDGEYSAYIRFYTYGLVLVTTSDKPAKEVFTWFNNEPQNQSRVLSGKYKIAKKGCKINFKVKGETGEQFFEGLLNGNDQFDVRITNPKQSGKKKASTRRIYSFFES